MNIYGLEEYTKNEYSNLACQRVIAFTLLRSNVYVCIDDNMVTVTQQPHTIHYANEIIKEKEHEEIAAEKLKIKYWVSVHLEQLKKGISAIEIIKKNTLGYSDILTLNVKKPIILGIEYAREKLLKEIEEKKEETIDALKKAAICSSEFEQYCNMLGVNKQPAGTETVRFYVKHSDIESVTKVDINIDESRIVEVIPGAGLVDYEPLKYFCSRYFELIKEHTPLEDIAALDNGNTITYAPSLFKPKTY